MLVCYFREPRHLFTQTSWSLIAGPQIYLAGKRWKLLPSRHTSLLFDTFGRDIAPSFDLVDQTSWLEWQIPKLAEGSRKDHWSGPGMSHGTMVKLLLYCLSAFWEPLRQETLFEAGWKLYSPETRNAWICNPGWSAFNWLHWKTVNVIFWSSSCSPVRNDSSSPESECFSHKSTEAFRTVKLVSSIKGKSSDHINIQEKAVWNCVGAGVFFRYVCFARLVKALFFLTSYHTQWSIY